MPRRIRVGAINQRRPGAIRGVPRCRNPVCGSLLRPFGTGAPDRRVQTQDRVRHSPVVLVYSHGAGFFGRGLLMRPALSTGQGGMF